MSEILIKGMELPKEIQCCYTIFPNGKVIVHWDGKVLGEAKAIEVQPHGRLGDLDALVSNIKNVYCNGCKRSKVMCNACKYGDILYEIDDAPTVLESSN